MNVSAITTKDYENIANCKLCENKANSKPNKANLQNARMNLNFYSTKDYENKSNCSLAENKPNTKPIQTQTNPTCSELACPERSRRVEPISKAKLKPYKLELIMRIWCYKSTIALTFARNSLIILGTRCLLNLVSPILRYETAFIEKGDK